MLKDENKYIKEENGVLFYDESNPLIYSESEWLEKSDGRAAIVVDISGLAVCIIALPKNESYNINLWDYFSSKKYSSDRYSWNTGHPNLEEGVDFIGYCD